MNTQTSSSPLEAIKDRQQKTWSSGDYGKIAWLTVPAGGRALRRR